MNSTFVVSLEKLAAYLHCFHSHALPFFKNFTFFFSSISLSYFVQCGIRWSLDWWCYLQDCIDNFFFNCNHQKMTPTLFMEQPLLLNTTLSGFQTYGLQNLKEDTDTMMMDDSGGGLESSKLMMELTNKILAFRDIVELPSYDSSDLIHLAIRTIVDLHKLYPNMVRFNLSSVAHKDSVTQCLVHLYAALKSVGKLWGVTDSKDEAQESLQNIELDQLVGKLMAKLTFLTTSAKEMFGVMDEDEDNEKIESCRKVQKTLTDIYSRNSITSPYPDASPSISPESTPTVNLEEISNVSSSQTHLSPLCTQEIGNLKQHNTVPDIPAQNSGIVDETRQTVSQLNAIEQFAEEPKKVNFEGPNEHLNTRNDVPEIPKQESSVEREATHTAAVPPPPAPPLPPRASPSSVEAPKETKMPTPPPIPSSVRSEAMSPPPMVVTKGAAPPPPPPLSLVKAVRMKRVASKLKRSSQMSNLYRFLRGKVEGSSSRAGNGTSPRKKTKIGESPKGKGGMAEALTEITKRSSYFKKIEEDVVKHEKLILELKAAITSFQTNDMDELIKFHKHVEQNLEKLTDETQVLPRFEGFPMKKLESLRAAAALYLKLNGILTDLQNWKVTPPVGQLLDKVESYFNKIKSELDTLERSKDEDSKQFQGNNIHFDFGILDKIKESLVDISSSCMELALKEEREAAVSDAESGGKNKSKRKNCIKMLWRAFQLAFRVYNFAGGQDDRADKLSVEVAHEIEIDE